MTEYKMDFREFKIGFYTPKETVLKDRLLDAYNKMKDRFRLDSIFEWFVPEDGRPVQCDKSDWVEIARAAADLILLDAKADAQSAIVCGPATIRNYDPPTEEEVKRILDVFPSTTPIVQPADRARSAREGAPIVPPLSDAVRNALGRILSDRLNREGEPKIHCEFIAGKWIDTVEFLLNQTDSGKPTPWYVIDEADKVIFTASITYCCPDGPPSPAARRRKSVKG